MVGTASAPTCPFRKAASHVVLENWNWKYWDNPWPSYSVSRGDTSLHGETNGRFDVL